MIEILSSFIVAARLSNVFRFGMRNTVPSTITMVFVFHKVYGLCVPQSALTKFIRDGPPTYVGFEVIYQKKI